MVFLAVDDEPLLLNELVEALKGAEPEAEIAAFQKSHAALDYAKEHRIDVAFLDINMRGIDGISLAKHLKVFHPNVNIIFCTGYSEYYADAFKVKASGYLLKPIKAEAVREELDDLRRPVETKRTQVEGVYIRCFGGFELFCNGMPVKFKIKKTKELFAYLVDQEGILVRNKTIEAVLFEDDGSHRSYIQKMKRDLMNTLKEYQISDILVHSLRMGEIGIAADRVNCDYYNWKTGDPEAVRNFNGEYMEEYTWAESTKAAIMKWDD